MEEWYEMKITDLAITFTLIALCLFIQIDIKINNMTAIEYKKVAYNNYLDNAVDDAVLNLIDFDNKKRNSYSLNKQKCINNFYNSLYANFGIISDTNLKETIKRYIPIIMITDNDGFYVYYKEKYNDSTGNRLIKEIWSEKIPYTYEDEKYIYSFSFSTYLRVFDKGCNKYEMGEYEDLKRKYEDSLVFKNQKSFDEIRRLSIISTIEKKMNYYINQYNMIADQFGIKYNFSLPSTAHDEFARTIDNIGMFVVFQGFPYGISTCDTYNRFAFGASRIMKNVMYYVNEINGKLTYHYHSCERILNKNHAYRTKKECAKVGAYPCELCNP